MRISDWSSDVCSSDLAARALDAAPTTAAPAPATAASDTMNGAVAGVLIAALTEQFGGRSVSIMLDKVSAQQASIRDSAVSGEGRARRSEEHTSELPSLMRTSYAVFCVKKKKHQRIQRTHHIT